MKSCALGGMLGALAEMKKSGKWGLILDCNGNVGTFMKYKAAYYAGFDHIVKPLSPELMEVFKRKWIKYVISGFRGGGTLCIDFDTFGDNKEAKPEMFLNEEWIPNVTKPAELFVYENLEKIGGMYPDVVKEIIGENKGLYTPKDNPAYFCFCMKSKEVPENFKGGNWEVLKVT